MWWGEVGCLEKCGESVLGCGKVEVVGKYGGEVEKCFRGGGK